MQHSQIVTTCRHLRVLHYDQWTYNGPVPRCQPDSALFLFARKPVKNPQSPANAAIQDARLIAGLTQLEAAAAVQVSLRAWQHWEAGDRAMPPGLFELFMLKTGQWALPSVSGERHASRPLSRQA